MDTTAQHLASPPEAYKWGNLMGSGKLSEEMAVEQNMALFGQVSWFLCFFQIFSILTQVLLFHT